MRQKLTYLLAGFILGNTVVYGEALFPLPPMHNDNDSAHIRAMKQSWYDKAVADYMIEKSRQPCD